MSKFMKKLIKDEFKEAFEGVSDMILVDASRLPAQEAWELRGRVREAGMRMKMVKNSLARLAFHEVGITTLDEYLSGPVTVLIGEEGAAKIARLIEDWNKGATPLEWKAGLLDGSPGDAEEVKSWSKLPTREEMLAQLLGVLIAPATNMANLFQATATQFVNCVAAHIDKMEKGDD